MDAPDKRPQSNIILWFLWNFPRVPILLLDIEWTVLRRGLSFVIISSKTRVGCRWRWYSKSPLTRLNQREDSSIFVVGRAHLPARHRQTIRQSFHKPANYLAPPPWNGYQYQHSVAASVYCLFKYTCKYIILEKTNYLLLLCVANFSNKT